MPATRAILVCALVIGAAASPSLAQVEIAFPNLSFSFPTDLQHAPDGTDRLFVTEQPGVIRVFENDAATTASSVFLDITARVLSDSRFGLLGLAFHPDYANNGYFYVHYTAALPTRSVIARFSVGADPNQADDQSELVLLEVGQPHNFHNGGQLAFGPDDGYLYITFGDGGPWNGTPDPSNHGQNRQTLLGSMLRIDVDDTDPGLEYAIPPDNPFVGNTQGWREEIWAWGFRNTWRFSFDPVTGLCWGGENGENLWEEINLIESGQNYGWKIMEGSQCFGGGSCNTSGLTLPLYEYDGVTQPRRSVIGGYVYRGSANPEIAGKYVFGDFVRETIWSLDWNGIDPPVVDVLATGETTLTTFGLDENGELYWCHWLDGRIYRFTPTATTVDPQAAPAAALLLAQNAPNPFNPYTRIDFELESGAVVTLSVFDATGRRVRDVVSGWMAAGAHQAVWDGTDASRREVPSGVYYYRLDGDAGAIARSMTLVR